MVNGQWSMVGAWVAVAIVVAICAGCERDAPNGGGAKGVTVVVSGDTGGWITPCGCASNQSGGLLRRGAYLEGLKKSEARLIFLDAGGGADCALGVCLEWVGGVGAAGDLSGGVEEVGGAADLP